VKFSEIRLPLLTGCHSFANFGLIFLRLEESVSVPIYERLFSAFILLKSASDEGFSGFFGEFWVRLEGQNGGCMLVRQLRGIFDNFRF